MQANLRSQARGDPLGYPFPGQNSSTVQQGDLLREMVKFQLAYDSFKKDWGESDQDVLRSLVALGMSLYYQGVYVDARQKIQRAYEGYRIVFGSDNPDMIELRNVLEDDILREDCLKDD
jgi:hypothetical protein